MFGKSMIYIDSNSVKNFCTCQSCNQPTEDEKIPTYYSLLHATDMGWLYTNNIKHCPPNQEGAWVCPDCTGHKPKST